MTIQPTHSPLMNRVLCLLPALSTVTPFALAAETPKPAFQYKSQDIEVPAATADEPRVEAFNAQTVSRAVKYLEDGARAWVRERSCVACHTTGPYMVERPALTRLLGTPSLEVRASFIQAIPDQPPQPTQLNGEASYPAADRAVWRSAGLAEWDKHVSGKLSEDTDRSLRDMFLRQSADGRFTMVSEVEIPHVTSDFELTLQAARAVTAAPGWLTNLKHAELRRRVELMKAFLREDQPRNDYERVLRLQLATWMPELVSADRREAALAVLWQKQLPDGGWSTRRMSDVSSWRTPMSERVIALIEGEPDAANPGSDSYMTAFAIVLLREAGVPAGDARIQRGLAWLKANQRASGRWWLKSLYRDNLHYFTYIATVQALKALALCGELPGSSTR